MARCVGATHVGSCLPTVDRRPTVGQEPLVLESHAGEAARSRPDVSPASPWLIWSALPHHLVEVGGA